MTRDEEIGRAARKAFFDKRSIKSQIRSGRTIKPRLQTFITTALAAVSRAREIDTCETCKHRDDYVIIYNVTEEIPCHFISVGCNRHQPKE